MSEFNFEKDDDLENTLRKQLMSAPIDIVFNTDDEPGDLLEDEDVEKLIEKEKELLMDLSSFIGEELGDASIVEQTLVRGMDQLTFEEKEKAAFDVHGLSMPADISGDGKSCNQVSPMELDKLQQLQQELQEFECRDYQVVKDQEFQLMFLRCEEYDVKLAAQRIQMHMEIRKNSFGEHTLDRPLEPSDLSPEAVKILATGSCPIHVAKKRDAAGRLVVIRTSNPPPNVAINSLIQLQHFLLTQVASMPDVQKNGSVVVILLSWKDPLKGFKKRWDLQQKMKPGFEAIPRKVAAVHFCVDSSMRGSAQLQKIIALSFQFLVGQRVRSRARTHLGTKEMLKLKLQSYGITISDEDWDSNTPSPTVCHPISTPAKVSNASSSTTGKQRSTSVSSTETSATTTSASTVTTTSASAVTTTSASAVTPTEHDILLGRGKHTRLHHGNVRALELVNKFRGLYEGASKVEKTAIAENIVLALQESGGRFLKLCEETNEWHEVDIQAARNKISHLYRNTRKK